MHDVKLDDATLSHGKGGYTLEVAGLRVQVDLTRSPPLVIAEGHYLEVWTNSLYEVRREHQYKSDINRGDIP